MYKRSSNILNAEEKISIETLGFADPGLFKNDYEKKLYKKINDIRKYFLSIGKDENYEESLIFFFFGHRPMGTQGTGPLGSPFGNPKRTGNPISGALMTGSAHPGADVVLHS